jgi:hypothetical protein
LLPSCNIPLELLVVAADWRRAGVTDMAFSSSKE